VEEALSALQEEYRNSGRPRGMELREVGGGWRFYSAAEFSPVVEGFVRDGQTARLTQAGLETLAVIAYRQPVSRGRISAIRGVEEALSALQEEYRNSGRPRGMELREVGGGWRFYSAAEFSPVVEGFVRDGQTARLTQAGLETLAVIAYRQPVSRGRISAIRGV